MGLMLLMVVGLSQAAPQISTSQVVSTVTTQLPPPPPPPPPASLAGPPTPSAPPDLWLQRNQLPRLPTSTATRLLTRRPRLPSTRTRPGTATMSREPTATWTPPEPSSPSPTLLVLMDTTSRGRWREGSSP